MEKLRGYRTLSRKLVGKSESLVGNKKVHCSLSTHLLHLTLILHYRRERNRMHAKMTRDRKKMFITSTETKIEQLVRENNKMRQVLATVAERHFGRNAVTPNISPMFSGAPYNNTETAPDIQDRMSVPAMVAESYNGADQGIAGHGGVPFPIPYSHPVVSD